MKINYLFKNMGRVCLAIVLLATTLLTSCKDNSPGSIDFSKSPALISWQFAGFSEVPYTAAVLPLASQTYSLEVTLSVASLTLSSPVTATAVEDPASLTAYNTANGTSLTELPTSQYTLPSGGKITISPGQQIVKFPITFQGNLINFNIDNALALKLTGANGATIATNLNVAVVLIKLKSIYEDTYSVVSGATTRFNGGNEASGVRDVFNIAESALAFSTVNVNTVSGQVGSSSFGVTAAYQISGSSVTVLPDPAGTIGSTTFNFSQGDSKGTSSYNAATKTLIIHCGYLNSAGALREIDMNLVGE